MPGREPEARPLPTLDMYMPKVSNRYSTLSSSEQDFGTPADYLEPVSCPTAGVFAVDTGHAQGRVIEGVMDSGAAESVAPRSVTNAPAAVDPRTANQKYRTACGHELPNLGCKTVTGQDRQGNALKMRYQIADVARPLNSVSRICDRGCEVIFRADGCEVVNMRSGKRVPFERRGGVYVMTVWAQDESDNPTGQTAADSTPGFSRRE